MRSRSKSVTKNQPKQEDVKPQAGFIVRRNSKLAHSASYSTSEFRTAANKRKSSFLNVILNIKIKISNLIDFLF